MRFGPILSALSLVTAVIAQDTTIEVGLGGLKFTPSNITLTEGSVVTFNFTGSPGNHTVTQSSFSSPCEPLVDGFDSGYVYIPTGTTSGFPTWNLTITNVSTPIWFFCKAGSHCKAGMVGAINAPSSGNTFEAFLSKAEAVTVTPSQNPGALSGIGAFATALPGPFSGSITGYGEPSGVKSSSVATSPSPSSSKASSASAVSSSIAAVLFSALLVATLI